MQDELSLADPASLRSQTALDALAYLHDISSSRADEFRKACDDKFELATIFKTSEECAALRKQAIAPPPDASVAVNGDEDKTDVVS